jgi:hypothetical protein
LLSAQYHQVPDEFEAGGALSCGRSTYSSGWGGSTTTGAAGTTTGGAYP